MHGMPKKQLRKPPLGETVASQSRSGAAAVRTGAAGRQHSRFDGRRDENVDDTRPCAGEDVRGESTVAPCPLAAVQATLAKTNSGLVITWCAGF